MSKKNDDVPEILPGLADIYAMAYRTIDHLPERFQEHAKKLIVRVENFADTETLNGLGVEDKYDLLGLYRGVPLPFKHHSETLSLPDIVFLYRCPLIRFAQDNGQEIQTLVTHVMIHEIGHHFGYSDFDMEWVEKMGKESKEDGGRNRD